MNLYFKEERTFLGIVEKVGIIFKKSKTEESF
jgi:hypothetical protein